MAVSHDHREIRKILGVAYSTLCCCFFVILSPRLVAEAPKCARNARCLPPPEVPRFFAAWPNVNVSFGMRLNSNPFLLLSNEALGYCTRQVVTPSSSSS